MFPAKNTVNKRNFPFNFRYKIPTMAVLTIIGLTCLMIWIGCSGPNYGGFRNSREVKQAFETYHVYPDHRYYYLHLENNPYAVIAIQQDYTLDDWQWKEFDPRTDKLEKLVELVERFPVRYSYTYGSYLVDPMGNQIGYWYSSLRIRNLKVDSEAKRVAIYTDTPWLRDDDDIFRPGFGSGGSGIGISIDR